jgi:hypothetical protein
LIEGWAVQFIPVKNSLDAEALANAAEVDLEVNPREGSVSTRVLLLEHIVAIALRVGRARDRSRIIHILALRDVIGRHGLGNEWTMFCRRVGIADPCAVKSAP